MRLWPVVVVSAALLAAGGIGCEDGEDDGGAGGAGGAGDGGAGGDGRVACVVDESYDPAIDPAEFVAGVTNPYFPLVPGTTSIFESPEERIEVVVTADTKEILGVTCVVVRDTVSVDGEVTEDTFDWYAQDAAGNVWYFGEDSKEYEDGQLVSTEGSWEAGVDGAKPGIVMQASPAPGSRYRQEYYACHAEDEAEVVAVGTQTTVPAGTFTDCVQTREFTRLEPEVEETKYHCRDVGLVAEEGGSGGRVELISNTPP